METTIYKFKIPSKEDYYSMSFEERHTTAGIYNAYKNFFFIILKRERNSHYICVVCESYKMNKSQKEWVIKIKYKDLVRISDSCLEKVFVTNINMNSVYKKVKPNYKNINKYLVFKKPKKSVSKINTSKKSNMKKHKKVQKSVNEIKKDNKNELCKITKQENIKSRKKRKKRHKKNKVNMKITPAPMTAYEKRRYNSFCYWNCMHPVSAGRGNF